MNEFCVLVVSSVRVVEVAILPPKPTKYSGVKRTFFLQSPSIVLRLFRHEINFVHCAGQPVNNGWKEVD